MPETISTNEFRLLRDYIERHCGIALGEEKAYLVESRLAGLLVETGSPDFGALYRLVSTSSDTRLRDKIVDAMTTNETLWFRDGHPYAILQEVLLPAFAEDLRSGRRFRIRIWSAASSTGQEPYSIALCIQEYIRQHPGCGIRPEQFEIMATDISPSALFIAQSGRYDANAMSRGMPEDLKHRYFRNEGPVWILDDAVKRMVSLRKFNLQDSMEPLGHFDVVFIRYVTIYFSEDFKRQVYQALARVLSGQGHLFISAVETLRNISEAFEPLSHGSGMYYRCLH